MAMIDTDDTRFQDWINLAIGTVLAISPWVFGFSGETTQTQVAVGSGILVALVAVAALVRFAEWEEWLNMLLGLAIAISPFIFGFTGDSIATQTMFIGGILVVLMAGWEVWTLHHRTQTIR